MYQCKNYSLILEGFFRTGIRRITEALPFETNSMMDSFKYLGFHLKPDTYRKQDWFWLVEKIENWVKQWSYKWLSRVGRLVLIKMVLMVILVYWTALTWVPK